VAITTPIHVRIASPSDLWL